MSEIDLEELEQIKEQAFREGVMGTLTRLKFLVEQEKDPEIAVKKLLKEIDNIGKQCVNDVATMCLHKLAKHVLDLDRP